MKTLKKNAGKMELLNGYVVNYNIVSFRTTGIFWKTVDGRWMKKIHAIRAGIALTGEHKEMETAPQALAMPA